jgi:hypothetical protein
MTIVDDDADEWTRLSIGARQFQDAADTKFFVKAVEQVLGALAPSRRSTR